MGEHHDMVVEALVNEEDLAYLNYRITTGPHRYTGSTRGARTDADKEKLENILNSEGAIVQKEDGSYAITNDAWKYGEYGPWYRKPSNSCTYVNNGWCDHRCELRTDCTDCETCPPVNQMFQDPPVNQNVQDPPVNQNVLDESVAGRLARSEDAQDYHGTD